MLPDFRTEVMAPFLLLVLEGLMLLRVLALGREAILAVDDELIFARNDDFDDDKI